MLKLNRGAVLALCASSAGCTTMSSIDSGSPSYTVAYSGVEQASLIDCVLKRMDEKAAYANQLVDGPKYPSIETFSVLGVPYFSTRFYDNRVEIYGRPSIAGDYGKQMIPVVKACVSDLGGKAG